ncbi:MAG TPA: type I restriction endonuclease subunit S [Pseudomonas sp.]|nr:type I restriction endonuclease subunit S [Pseudomonas sp.]
MTALLTDNLPLLASAPNGIKKLRELILELAVRGKLVPQDPSDEPASELLKRIVEEKARLVAEGKIKKQKPLAEISDDEKPFELPAGWMWTRLGDICLTQTGTTPSKSQPELFGLDVPFIKPGDIYPDQVDYSGEGLSSLGASQSGRIAQAGSLLMVCIGTIGKCNLIERDCSFNQQINSATLYKGLPQYLRIAARSPYFQAEAWSESSSTTIAILNKGKWEAISLPLPSITEQHRIVAKVDELMALCDHLEAQQADAESAHAQLVQALLGSLTQATDAEDFAASWQRLAEHFHTLFTTESSIDALKQTLLQLAVMGKLVPQDPSDEPASELLRRLANGKAELVRSGLLKAPKPLPDIKQHEIPYELPQAWKWVRLGEVSEFVNGDRGKNYPNRTEYVSAGIPWINTGHIEPDGTLSQDSMHYIAREKFESLNGGKIRLGDLVYCLRGATFGKTAIVDPYSEGAIASSLMIIRPFEPCSNRFMYRYLTSKIGRDQIFRFDNGSAQPNLSANNVRLYVYPLPPLPEQHRIVAKVDQLMALCDQLKTRLTQARQLNEQLATALVEQAVA